MPAPTVPDRTTQIARPGVIAITVAIAMLAAFLTGRFLQVGSGERPLEERNAIRFVVPPPEGSSFGGLPRISPDGRRLLSAVAVGGKVALWLRPLGAASGQVLPGTEVTRGPFLSLFWSPDGRSALFGGDGKLMSVDLEGQGTVKLIAHTEGSLGTAMNHEGVILLGRPSSGLHRVAASGGVPSPLLPLDSTHQEIAHSWPRFLPDGRHFLYFARSRNPAENAICVASLDRTRRKRLLINASHAEYGFGHLLYLKGNTLVAGRFDTDSLEFLGDPFPLAEDVGQGAYGNAAFSASAGGVMVYRSKFGLERDLVWVDPSGKRLGSIGPPGQYGNAELSPDGSRIAADRIEGPTQDIWTLDVAQGQPRRLTFDPAIDFGPIWSPDGSRIVFGSSRSGSGDLYQKASSGAGAEQLLLSWDAEARPTDWSPDGRFIAFNSSTTNTREDVWMLPLDGERKPIVYLQTQASERWSRFSPDGRWLAYVSDESGRAEVYVERFSVPREPRGRWQVSSEGGFQPAWRRDGKELFYSEFARRVDGGRSWAERDLRGWSSNGALLRT